MPLWGEVVVKRGCHVSLMMFVSGMSEPLRASLSRWLFTWRCPMRGLPPLSASAPCNTCRHTRARTHDQGPLMCSPPPRGAPSSPVAQREQQGSEGAAEARDDQRETQRDVAPLLISLGCRLIQPLAQMLRHLHQSTHLPGA